MEAKSNALREVARLDANSRLIKRIDVNVARQIMIFPQRFLMTWGIPLLDPELKKYSL